MKNEKLNLSSKNTQLQTHNVSRRSAMASGAIATAAAMLNNTANAAHHGSHNAGAQASGSRDLMLLVYTPREDSNQRGYEEWLQTIDNPFFNKIDGIKHYVNWRVSSISDCAFPYTHFDTMFLDNSDSKDKVWGNTDLANFAQGWTEQWGRYPKATAEEMQSNYSVYLCSHLSGDKYVKSENVAFMPANQAITPSEKIQTYEVSEAIVGDIRFKNFGLSFLENSNDYNWAASNRPSESYGAAHGTIIASPDA